MTIDRRLAAIKLRQAGHSIKAISSSLGAAQSSVSIWVRGVTLTVEQKNKLKASTHSRSAIEKRRLSRLQNEQTKRQLIMNEAQELVGSISKRELWLIGVALYWAEGGKTQSIVRFSNGDPKMIQIMLRFFREICDADESKIRCHIHIHESLDSSAAEEYWHEITSVPLTQFYKTYNKPNKSSKGYRHSLPYGVCDVYVLNAKLLLRIFGWIEGIYGNGMAMVQ